VQQKAEAVEASRRRALARWQEMILAQVYGGRKGRAGQPFEQTLVRAALLSSDIEAEQLAKAFPELIEALHLWRETSQS
jgi:hypothetical protein